MNGLNKLSIIFHWFMYHNSILSFSLFISIIYVYGWITFPTSNSASYGITLSCPEYNCINYVSFINR